MYSDRGAKEKDVHCDILFDDKMQREELIQSNEEFFKIKIGESREKTLGAVLHGTETRADSTAAAIKCPFTIKPQNYQPVKMQLDVGMFGSAKQFICSPSTYAPSHVCIGVISLFFSSAYDLIKGY